MALFFYQFTPLYGHNQNYLVTIKIGKVITNKLVKAETAEEAEKEALRCASQETTDLQAQN